MSNIHRLSGATERLLTVAELAAHLSMSERWIRYGHSSEDAARARVAAAYDPEVAPLRAAQKLGRRP